jgi:hypothetical protein
MLGLAILGLASLASASSIDYASGGSGSDVKVVGSPTAGHTWSVTDDLTEIGSQQGAELGTVDITSGKLASCAQGLCFSGGTVVIKSESGAMIFSGTFTSGTVTSSNGNTFLNANLVNGGTTEIDSKSGVVSSNTVVGTVPEPSALWLLGTGLVGLSFMRRLVH